MTGASPRLERTAASLLYVATVSATVRHFLIPFAGHFRSRGWRVEAAARGATSDAALSGAFDAVRELPLSRSLRDIAGIVRAYRAVASLVTSGHDIVHVHTPIASFLTRLAARRVPIGSRPAIVYTAHGFHFHQGGHPLTNLLFLAAERMAGRWTDRLVVINDEDFEAARRHRLVAPGRLVRMPGIGVDTDRYAPSTMEPGVIAAARASLGITSDAPMFLSIGELSRRKRHADAIAALAAMDDDRAHLVVLGEGPTRGPLEALARELGVHRRVSMPGFVGDVRPLLAGATALVHPADREGLSRAVMEALALEVPVIASSARGNEELVGDSGWVVPIGHVARYAEAMDRLVREPDHGRGMGRRARARMVARYDVRLVIRLHEDLYDELLAARASARE